MSAEDIPADLSDEGVIEYLKMCRRNQAETIMVLLTALEAIRDMPTAQAALPPAELVAKMREVARKAVGEPEEDDVEVERG